MSKKLSLKYSKAALCLCSHDNHFVSDEKYNLPFKKFLSYVIDIIIFLIDKEGSSKSLLGDISSENHFESGDGIVSGFSVRHDLILFLDGNNLHLKTEM